jgi:predicted metal-dependent hydrolase
MVHEAFDHRYLRGIEEFNRRNFFESHEIWEDLWRDEEGPAREFYQGLIQVAVALHHLAHGNRSGADRLLEKAKCHLQRFPAEHLGLDLGRFLQSVDDCFAHAAPGEAWAIAIQLIPPS